MTDKFIRTFTDDEAKVYLLKLFGDASKEVLEFVIEDLNRRGEDTAPIAYRSLSIALRQYTYWLESTRRQPM